MQLRALPPTARKAVASPLATIFSRGASLAHKIGCPVFTGSSKNLSASPGTPDNQLENLNAKLSKPLDSPFHSFGRPRLQSDPTPNVHTRVNPPRVQSQLQQVRLLHEEQAFAAQPQLCQLVHPVNISTRELGT